MSDYATRQQPPPTGEGLEVWPLVVEDVRLRAERQPAVPWGLLEEDGRARDAMGRERYGTPLRTHNGRDALADAYQEALDLCAYLRQALAEHEAEGRQLSPVIVAYDSALVTALRLRRLLEREGRQ